MCCKKTRTNGIQGARTLDNTAHDPTDQPPSAERAGANPLVCQPRTRRGCCCGGRRRRGGLIAAVTGLIKEQQAAKKSRNVASGEDAPTSPRRAAPSPADFGERPEKDKERVMGDSDNGGRVEELGSRDISVPPSYEIAVKSG